MNWIIVAVLLAITQAASPVPRQASNRAASRSQSVQKKATRKHNPPAPASVPGHPESNENQDAGKAPTQTDAQKAIVIREPVAVTVRTSGWDHLYVIFTGCLVVIGGLGVFFALRTLKVIQRQALSTRRQTIHLRHSVAAARRNAKAAKISAEFMVRQVKLQEAGMRQWVNLEKWTTGSSPIRPKNELVVEFQIVNPTQVPLTLDAVLNKIGGGQSNDQGITGLLAPGNPYIVTLPMRLSDEQMAAFDQANLVLTVRCDILFTDAMERKWQQIFGRMMVCGPRSIWVSDIENKLRSSEPPQNSENPN